MNPDQQPDSKLQNVYNPLGVMRENEQIICEIKRHPIGIVGMYVVTGIIVAVVVAAAIFVPGHIANVTSQVKAELWSAALIVAAIALLYAYIARVVYTGNRWILTDDSLTQVSQNGLFRKQSSQLSLASLEDVTVDQNGIMPSMFGYGVLHAETAGERSKFVFPYCPSPNENARKILTARENFIMNEPERARRANDKLMTPGMMQGYGSQQPPYEPISPVPPPAATPPQPQPMTPNADSDQHPGATES